MLTLSGAGQPQNGVGIEERFVISVKTDNAGTSLDNQYTIPMVNSVPYDIKTSDGQTINNVINNYTITFPTPGTYEVKLSPSSIDGSISLDNNYAADKYKLINVLNWGVNNIANLNGLFSGSGIIAISAIDIPVLNNPNGGVNLHQVFGNTSSLLDVPNLELWDTSDVSSFRSSFYNSKLFSNENENTLDLSNWDTSNVNDFSYMFYMGNGKGKVDFNMGAWNIENMTQAISFYAGYNAQPISIENYNSTLISWAAQNATSNISISFGSSQYSYEAAAARQSLIDTYGWTITDGGQAVSPEFVISVKTDNAGVSDDNQYILGWIGTYDVDWGDGNNDLGVVDFQTHTYASPGTYEVKVKATTGRWAIGHGGDRDKNIDILNWGTCAWTSMAGTLNTWRGNKNITATDIPNLTQCTDMSRMFKDAKFETVNLVGWDVTNVTTMQDMFRDAAQFQPYDPIIDVSGWDMSNCQNIRYMFSDFGKFGSSGNNGYIGDISNWDTGNVIMMDAFAKAEIIAGPNFTAANWDVSSVTNGIEIGINQTIENYDATLINFASQSPQSNLVCKFGTNRYSYEGASARQTLIDTYGWTITDGGQAVSPEFVISVKTDNDGTSNDNQFTIPWVGTYDIDWGDGVVETGLVNTQTHTYSSVGTYDVKVTATTGRINFQFAGDRKKLIDIKNWGSIIWGDMGGAFNGTLNLLNLSAVDTPDFSQNVSMRSIFAGSNLFRKTNPTTPHLSSWDVSNVRDFAYAFYNGLYPGGKVDFDMSSWNIENMVTGTDFIGGWNTDSLSTANYDSTLISWASQNVNSNVSINFGNAQYTLGAAAEAARNTLINTYGWTITDGGGGIFVGLLDTYPNASAAYSLRDLASASVGSAVARVRRSSDNTEQDFTASEITDGTLITFTGANDGFVTTWYDQSGNSNNAAQATAINQPKLVDSGVLQLDNLNPAINFSLGGSNSFTLNNRILDVQSVFQVLNAQPSTGNHKQFILGDSSSADYHSGLGELLISSQWASDTVIDGKHYINQQQYDFTSTNKPTNQSVLSLIAETPSTKVNQLTKDRGGKSSWEGKMQEIILYPTDESANKSGIEKNINTKYNIYPENTAISGLLFDYPNASAAYSLRQLTTFNTGFKPIIVKVRRSSDNTEQTFTATEITDGTLTTFTGANDGFVVTWYDQSNNMGWAKQQTATNQPKIVSSGVVELENGKPTLKFNGTNKLISNNLNTNLQPNSYFMAFNFISGESIFDGNGNRNAFYQYQGFYRMFANTQATTSFSTTSGMVLSANLFNGSNSFMSLNGVLETGLNVGNSNQRGLIIGGNGTNNINGTVSEFIMYPTDQSANRTGIENNINTEYNIY